MLWELITFLRQEFPGKNKMHITLQKTGCSELSNPFFLLILRHASAWRVKQNKFKALAINYKILNLIMQLNAKADSMNYLLPPR